MSGMLCLVAGETHKIKDAEDIPEAWNNYQLLDGQAARAGESTENNGHLTDI